MLGDDDMGDGASGDGGRKKGSVAASGWQGWSK